MGGFRLWVGEVRAGRANELHGWESRILRSGPERQRVEFFFRLRSDDCNVSLEVGANLNHAFDGVELAGDLFRAVFAVQVANVNDRLIRRHF